MKKILGLTLIAVLFTACCSKSEIPQPKPELVKVTVLSTTICNRGFNVDTYSVRCLTSDSIVYIYLSDDKYEVGDKILLPVRNGKIIY